MARTKPNKIRVAVQVDEHYDNAKLIDIDTGREVDCEVTWIDSFCERVDGGFMATLAKVEGDNQTYVTIKLTGPVQVIMRAKPRPRRMST